MYAHLDDDVVVKMFATPAQATSALDVLAGRIIGARERAIGEQDARDRESAP